MSSSVLSNNNCGPVAGLLGNQTFLLHTPSQQKITKTISSPLWRTFYTPPIIEDNNSNGTDASISPTTPQFTLTVHSSPTSSLSSSPNYNNNSNNNNYNNNTVQAPVVYPPNQRMTLQKLPQSVIDNTTSGAVIQKPIMSVSKLVRPTPKSQHPHHHQHHHHQQQQQHHHHQHQPHHHSHHHHQHQHQHQHELQLNSGYSGVDVQSGPINLVTNTQSDSVRSRPSSTSSVDIESDDIPEAQQQQQQRQQQGVGVAGSQTVAIPTLPSSAYQFNYNHLYANKAGYHNAAVANAAAAAAAADTLRMHSSYPYVAIAAAAAAAASINVSTASTTNNNIFPMNPMSSATLSHHPNNSTAMHIALAPPPQPQPLSSSSSQSSSSQSSPVTSIVTTSPGIGVPTNALLRSMDAQHEQNQRLGTNEPMFSPPLSTALPTALSNGTYINYKSSPPSEADSSSDNYFKVPNSSGKEGSLKHRILTRPTPPTEREEKPQRNATISTHNSTANFKKGSYIELANGVLRRVEDMRTEDFIQCADRSLHLQLAESTVVRIDTTKPQMVVITFSYDKNRSKADIEVSVDHPFFVYGQGWASCEPEKSDKAFGLKCQRLQVGDICISLTQRPTPLPLVNSEMINKELSTNTDTLRYTKVELPQNNEVSPIPTMAIKTELHTAMPPPPPAQFQHMSSATNAVLHRVPPPPPPQPMHFIPCHIPGTPIPHHQMPYHDFAELVAAAVYNSSPHVHHMPTSMPPPPSPDAINGFYQQSQQLFLQGKASAAELRLQPPPPPSPSHPTAANVTLSYCPPRTSLLPALTPQHVSPMLDHMQDQPFDASIASRKRRWSAPEGESDEVDDRRDHCQNSKLYKAVIAPVTT